MSKGPNISEPEGQRRALQRAMSIREFCASYSVGRTSVYSEIRSGRLFSAAKSRKAHNHHHGRRGGLVTNYLEFMRRSMGRLVKSALTRGRAPMASPRKKNRIPSPFAWRPIEMLASPALKALSLSARRFWIGWKSNSIIMVESRRKTESWRALTITSSSLALSGMRLRQRFASLWNSASSKSLAPGARETLVSDNRRSTA